MNIRVKTPVAEIVVGIGIAIELGLKNGDSISLETAFLISDIYELIDKG